MSDIVRRALAEAEDPATALVAVRGSSDVTRVEEAEEKALAWYLKAIRNRIGTDRDLRGTLCTDDFDAARPHVADMCRDLVYAGTEDVYERAVDTILAETRTQALSGAKEWLVDSETGRAVAPVTERAIFQPPDFVDDFGRLRQARPVVHPAITTALAMSRHEAARMSALRRKIGRPEFFAHIDDPGAMAESATRRLEAAGVRRAQDDEALPASEEVVFGREGPESLFQAPNPGFVRAEAFAAALAARVERLCGRGGRFRIGLPVRDANARGSWFTARVEFLREES